MVHLTLLLSTYLSFVKINKKKVLWSSFFLLFIFAALRYDFGSDYISYAKWFNYIKTTGRSPYGQQIIFTWLNKISPNYIIFLAITSGLYLFAVYKLIKNNLAEEYMGMAFLIFTINPYLFLQSLSAIRQSMAIVVFIIAIYYATQKKIVPYILLIITATLVHKSAIILLPVYFIANENKVKKSHIITTVSIILFLLLSPDNLTQIIERILEAFDDKNYTSYFVDSEQNSMRATLLSAVYLIYIILNIQKLKGKTLVYTKLYLVAIIFAVLAYNFSMLTRVQMYFDVFSIVSLPGIIEHNYKNNEKILSRAINVYALPILILLIYVLRYYSFFVNPLWESYRTYRTIIGVVI